MQLKSVRMWTNVYKDHASSYFTVARCLAQFKHPQRVFKYLPRTDRQSIIITDQNVQTVERIVMLDQHNSVRRVAYEFTIPTATVYESISNYLGLKKISTKWAHTYSTC